MNLSLFKKNLLININLGWLLFYLFFICYGYFGALSFSRFDYEENTFSCFTFSFLIIFSQASLGYIAHNFSKYLEKRIVIRFYNIFIFLSFFLVHLLLVWTRINNDLSVDELFYSQSAHRQAIEIVKLFYNFLPFISDIKAKIITQYLSLFFLICNVLIIYFTSKICWFYRVLFISILLILSKLIYFSIGGYNSPHPPLQYISPFISGSIFGINNYSFRLAYLIPYVSFISLLFFKLKNSLNSINSFLACLAITTIPICLNSSTIIEQSLWGFIAISLYLLSSNFKNIFELKDNIVFTSVLLLFRQTSFFIFIPLTIEYIQSNNKYFRKDIIFYTISFLLCGAFFIYSILKGTPTTEHLNQLPFWEKFTFIKEIFSTDVILKGILQSVDIFWISFFPFAFLKRKEKKYFRLNLLNLIFFIILLIGFHSIPKIGWEWSKYKLEYFIPFCILGFVKVNLFLKETFPKSHNLFIGILCATLIIFNLNSNKSFLNFHYSLPNTNSKINYGLQFNGFIKEPPPPFRESFDYISANNLSGKSFFIDQTYGNFNEIIHGYNVEELMRSELIFRKHYKLKDENKFKELASSIDNDKNLEVVVVPSSSTKNLNNFKYYLKQLNWSDEQEFNDFRYGTKVNIFVRGK